MSIKIENSWSNSAIILNKNDENLKIDIKLNVKSEEDLKTSLKYWIFENDFSLVRKDVIDLIKTHKVKKEVFYAQCLTLFAEKKTALRYENLVEFISQKASYPQEQWVYLKENFDKTFLDKPLNSEKNRNTYLDLLKKFPPNTIKFQELPEPQYKDFVLANCNNPVFKGRFCIESLPVYKIKDFKNLMTKAPQEDLVNFILNRDTSAEQKNLQVLIGSHPSYNFDNLPIKKKLFLDKLEDKLAFAVEAAKYLPNKQWFNKPADLQRFDFIFKNKKINEEEKLNFYKFLFSEHCNFNILSNEKFHDTIFKNAQEQNHQLLMEGLLKHIEENLTPTPPSLVPWVADKQKIILKNQNPVNNSNKFKIL